MLIKVMELSLEICPNNTELGTQFWGGYWSPEVIHKTQTQILYFAQ